MRVKAVSICIAMTIATCAFSDDQIADRILHHGKILTVDDDFRIVEAMALTNGKILRVGTNAEVLATSGSQTDLIDLKQQMVLPGLIDSHVHAIDASLVEFDHAIPNMNTINDVLDYVRGRAQVLEKGKWILVRQVFITRLLEPRYPTRAELDQAAPDHPVAFMTGPDASCNTLALKLSGIDVHSAPDAEGRVERDPVSGEPTGIIRSARNFLKTDDPSRRPNTTEQDQRLSRLLTDYHSVGITAAIDRAVNDDELAQYRRMSHSQQLNVRFGLSYHVDTSGRVESQVEKIEQLAKDPLCAPNDSLRLIGIKTFLDGGMLTGSAYMNQPWGVSSVYGIDDATYRGLRYIPHDQLVTLIRTAVDQNLQFTAHSVGDGAVQAMLDAYAEVSESSAAVRSTHCTITHSNFMSKSSVERAAQLGVCIDIQPAWLYLDTRTLVSHFGYDRLAYFQPLRSLFEAGVITGGGSDHMQKIGSMRAVNPYHPFWGMWITLARQARWYDGALHPEQRLNRRQAIEFYTRNNAVLMRMEDRIGSLEPGKLADFVVIDRDLLECPIEDVPATKVVATYIGGDRVWPTSASSDH